MYIDLHIYMNACITRTIMLDQIDENTLQRGGQPYCLTKSKVALPLHPPTTILDVNIE